MRNATIFGSAAETYKKGRPGYPGALFDWIAEHAPGRDLVWDCGTGSGQAAHALAQRFERVHATDISAQQLAQAPELARVTYTVADARASGLADGSCDAVTVATALHWFADEEFWNEVVRVLKTDGLFAAWVYDLMAIEDAELSAFYYEPVKALIAPYWSEGNRVAMAGYDLAALGCPLEPVRTPYIPYREEWSLDRIIGMARSWSATIRLLAEDGDDELVALENKAKARFGNRAFAVALPLSFVAGRKS
ncbi:MAG: class I SAM-dependent methyltransferase [Parvularcula sp.]|nr:class I SAM-dependent methyltransferase [Parvularcula sp.]